MSHFLPEAVTADSREELGVVRYRLRIHGRGTPTLDIDLALRGAAGLVELIPET